ncbi:MAG: hypothetical protein FWC45_01385 [Treponema sp.]|nr:hypothetical protein [Treponema sp.]
MRKNLPVLPERFRKRKPQLPLFPACYALPSSVFALGMVLFVFFVCRGFVTAQEPPPGEPPPAGKIRWYRTNPSGMALELIPSRLAALRNEYCLSVENAASGDLPDVLAPYYEYPFSIELRTLYRKGKESRRQWIFRNDKGLVRLTASGNNGLFGGAGSAEAKSSGFIEFRDSAGTVSREISYAEDLSEWEYRFFYANNMLIRTETLFKEAPPQAVPEKAPADKEKDENSAGGNDAAETKAPDSSPVFVPVTSDYYRYSRSGSLRAIDRTVHEGAGGKLSRITFPRIGPGVSPGMEIITNDIAFSSEFLSDIQCPEGITIAYALDSKGRTTSEVWKDKDGNLYGELQNTWSGDRLLSVLWKTPAEERLIEYEYDSSGNRIVERDYNQGILERTVTRREDKEVEELYLNGKVVLRAYWEKGLKISEERVSR